MRGRARPLAVLIGPEGGFATEERTALLKAAERGAHRTRAAHPARRYRGAWRHWRWCRRCWAIGAENDGGAARIVPRPAGCNSVHEWAAAGKTCDKVRTGSREYGDAVCVALRSVLHLADFARLCRRDRGPNAGRAASWLEKNFYLSGPHYDGVLPPCEAALGTIASRFAEKEGQYWNSDLQILDFERCGRSRSGPGRRNHSAPLLQRGGTGQRRAQAPGELLDRRGYRLHRRRPGASNGAWSASTATGPITPPARWRAP